MSYGKMKEFIDIISTQNTTDLEGFATTADTVLASVRAYFEQKNSTEKWQNMAQSGEVNALFRFRYIPGLAITKQHFIVCNGMRYNIYSVENIKGRNVYLEILAQGTPVAVSVDGSY